MQTIPVRLTVPFSLELEMQASNSGKRENYSGTEDWTLPVAYGFLFLSLKVVGNRDLSKGSELRTEPQPVRYRNGGNESESWAYTAY